jgi:hypothetical protein
MVKKLVIFIPVGNQQKMWTGFTSSYERAKAYLVNHVDELPYKLQFVEYHCTTFPVDAMRNECATRFVEGIPMEGKRVWNADISIWLDTDHTIPEDSLFRLLLHDLPIVCGIYYIKAGKRENPFYPVIFTRRTDKPHLHRAIMEWPDDGLFECDFTGMGAVCIKREVFDKLDKPYFAYSRHPKDTRAPDAQWKYDAEIFDISEDKHFWDQVKDKTDYKILVDPKVQFGHIGIMVFDTNMYKAWLGEYKKKLLKIHGKENFKKVWSEMGVAKPYNKETEDVKKAG